jgi:hypothetical protein
MDNEEFLRKLTEVSDWHRPMLGPNGCYSVNKNAKARIPPPQITEEELNDMTDEEVQDYYDELVAWRETQPNDSVQPVIKQVKNQPVDCEDCGVHCPNGRHTEHKQCITGKKHWRHKCVTCGLYKNPMSGKFDVTPQQSHGFFASYYREKKGVYASKFQTPREIIKQKIAKQPKPPKPEPEYEDVSVKVNYWLIRESGESVIRELKSTEKIERRLKRR